VTVQVNGEATEVDDGATGQVEALEQDRHGRGRGVAVAVDAEVVPRGEWDRTRLAPGARVEVVQAIQGG